MNLETPLSEVANHLPSELAELLLDEHEWVQTLVLTQIRAVVITIEESGTTLDTIQYHSVIGAVGPVLIASAGALMQQIIGDSDG